MRNDGAKSNKGEKPNSVATRSLASGNALKAEDERSNGADLMPLPFLLGVLNNAKASAAIKIKLASATLPYTHPKQSKSNATSKVVIDRYNFTVDPALAQKTSQ
jgi:hypothetical protein